MRLAGKNALITGAASGIGATCVALFKAQGARVAGVDLNTDGLAAQEALLDYSQRLDVTDRAAVDGAAESVASQFGTIDIPVSYTHLTLPTKRIV